MLIVLSACKPEGSMFETSRVSVKKPESVCGEDTASRCPQFNPNDFPKRVDTPRVLHRVEPQYPAPAREHGITGDVIVQAGIRRDGSVGGVCVVKPLPCGLSAAAVEAVKQWRFEPQDGNVVTNVAVHFPTESTIF